MVYELMKKVVNYIFGQDDMDNKKLELEKRADRTEDIRKRLSDVYKERRELLAIAATARHNLVYNPWKH